MALIGRQRNAPRSTGDRAEQLGCEYLQSRGLKPIARNYATRRGEIDLIMQDRHTLVFVEVRYRDDDSHGSAAETVTPHKQARLRLAASQFLQEHPALAERPCRFDVLAMAPDRENGRATINWIQDAFA